MRKLRHLTASLLMISLLLALMATAAADSSTQTEDDDLIAAWYAHLEEQGPSHASGGRPEEGPQLTGNPTDAVRLLRVGLRYSYTATGARSEWASYSHPQVTLTGTVGSFHVVDLATNRLLAAGHPGDLFTVSHNGEQYVVAGPDGAVVAAVPGPVRFRGNSPENTFRVPSITRINILTYRNWLTPEYHGEMEITRGQSTPTGRVSLVNIVDLESYLKGNVVNESPAFFHEEALKAQAVAARGYAVANVGRFTKPHGFDIDDSPGSQVYRGKTSEHPKGNAAVAATTGLVASYNGKMITAFYSSSMAGHTENYEWSFSSIGTVTPIPYLTGRYDGPAGTEPDLTTEAGRRAFWTTAQAQVYDSKTSSGNGRNRWTWTRARNLVEARLNAVRFLRTHISGSSTSIGTLEKCEITLRSPTGRAMVVRCTGSNAVWEFRGWNPVRQAFPHPTLGVLNNPAFLDHTYNADGTLASITVYGGGWGHNIGLSQWGAHGRGKAGQHFAQIMTFYYKDTAIGAYPIDIVNQPGSGPRTLRQDFVSPTGQGVLEVRAQGGMKGLNVTINETYDLKLSAEQLTEPVVRIDISAYLHAGLNVIQYNPVGTTGSATALVEIYR